METLRNIFAILGLIWVCSMVLVVPLFYFGMKNHSVKADFTREEFAGHQAEEASVERARRMLA